MTVRLFLIRHGETEWSRVGRHTGRSDIALTEHGRAQAAALAPVLARTPFVAVFTSPRRRAVDTCALAGLGAAAAVLPELAEWDYGDFEGMTAAEIGAQQAGWSAFGDGFRNGETFQEVSDRADRVIAQVAALSGDVALFSHGHFSCILAARWIGLAMQDARRFYLHTASVSIVGSHPSHAALRVMLQWNVVPGVNTPA